MLLRYAQGVTETTPEAAAVQRRQILDALRQYLRLQNAYDERVLESLHIADSQITRELATLARAGDEAIGDAVRIDQLRRTQSAIHDKLTKHWVRTGDITKAGQEEAAAAAARSQLDPDLWQNVIGDNGLAYMQASVEATAARGIDTLDMRLSGQSYVPLSERVYREGLVSNGKIDQIVNDALVRGASARDLANDVKAYVNPNTPGGVRYASMRLARTEINNAFHAQQIKAAKDQPWTTAVWWHLSGSHPVPDECNQNAEQTHFDGGDPGVYKPEDVPNKPHPQCLCFTTTIDVDPDEFIKEFNKGKYDAWLDTNGTVPQDGKSRGGHGGALALAIFLIPGPGALLAISAIRKRGFGLPGLPARVSPLRHPDRDLPQVAGRLFRVLPEDQRSAVEGYTDDYQNFINNALRDADDLSALESQLADQVRLIDQAIDSQLPTTSDITVYRGVGADVVQGLKLYDNFTERGYTSTTHHLDIADGYADIFPDVYNVEGRVIEIRIPRGSKILDLRDHPQFQDVMQQEVMLPRGSKFRVLGTQGDRLILELEPSRTTKLSGPSAGGPTPKPKPYKIVPQYNSLSALPKLSGPETPWDAIDRVNPTRSLDSFQFNCSYVINALELRARGYDVTAMPSPIHTGRSTDEIAHDWKDPITGKSPGWNVLNKPASGYSVKDVESATKFWPSNSRGFIYATDSPYRGHVFSIYKDANGKVHLLDGQFGVDLRFQIPGAHEIGVMRSDNLVPRLNRVLLQVTGPGEFAVEPNPERDAAILRRMKLRPKGEPNLGAAPKRLPLTDDELDKGLAKAERERQILEAAKYGYDRQEGRAREHYTEGSGFFMNALKRDPEGFVEQYGEGMVQIIAQESSALERLFTRHALQTDVVLTRGMTGDFSHLERGNFIADPGFLSTTTDLDTAVDFQAGRSQRVEGWLFIIHTPKGTPALPGADYQHEVILAPGTKQRILLVDIPNRTVYTEVVHDPTELGSLRPEEADVHRGLIEADHQLGLLRSQRYDANGDANAATGYDDPESRRALSEYIEGSHAMNMLKRDPEGFARHYNFGSDTLRDSWIVNIADKNAALERLMLKNRLTEDITVARGIQEVDFNNVRHVDFARMREGDFLTDPAFMSTTTELEMASDFSGRNEPNLFFPPVSETGWVMVIQVPKGTPALPGADYQFEMILPPGLQQQVLHVDVETHTIYTKAVKR